MRGINNNERNQNSFKSKLQNQILYKFKLKYLKYKYRDKTIASMYPSVLSLYNGRNFIEKYINMKKFHRYIKK